MRKSKLRKKIWEAFLKESEGKKRRFVRPLGQRINLLTFFPFLGNENDVFVEIG